MQQSLEFGAMLIQLYIISAITIILVLCIRVCYHYGYMLKLKNNGLKILNHKQTIDYVDKLLQTVKSQISKSTSVIMMNNIAYDTSKSINSLTVDKLSEIVLSIRDHVYSNLPKIITTKLLFDYMTKEQIYLMIYAEFSSQNNYYKIVTNKTTNTTNE